MLKIKHFQKVGEAQKIILCSDGEIASVFFQLEKSENGIWENRAHSFGGTVSLLDGGLCRWKNGKLSRTLQPVEAVPFKATDQPKLTGESPFLIGGLFHSQEKNKAAVYPAFLANEEELQFPVAGQDHFLFVVQGKAEWFNREKAESVVLAEKDLLQITRTQPKKEYLNLKVVGRSSRTILLWGVIHSISNY